MRKPILFVWFGFALAAGVVRGASTPMSVGNEPDSSVGLKTTIAALAEKKNRPAPDYARMAEETIQFGSRPDAVQKLTQPRAENEDPQAPWRNMVDDALAGVDEGERMDSKAADWPKLREELKKLQPPQPPEEKSSTKDKKKDKSEKDKKSGKDKGKPEKKKGQGEKSEDKDKGNGEGEQDKGDSQNPPTPGKGGQGGEPKDGESGQDSEKGNEGKQEQKEGKGNGKDPNQIKDYSSGKDQEGKMRDRAKEEDMTGIQDEKAGFGGLGQEKKDQDKKEEQKKGGMAGEGEKKEKGKEAPAGMRMVGGGSGKRENDARGDPMTQDTLSRLEQVRQSDSPASLQQRLQPKDQRPSQSSTAQPW